MPILREYAVVVDGIETTLQLTDEDARARGLKIPSPATPRTRAQSKPRAANKVRTPRTKAVDQR